MFQALARARARRRLETLAPNPRGKSPLRPARRKSGMLVAVVSALVTAALGAGAIWLVRTQASAPPASEAPGAFHACGNGRWVSDPARCG